MSKKIEIFRTNSGLRHEEYAYLLKLGDERFLCIRIDALHPEDTGYTVGQIVTDEYGDLFPESCSLDIRKTGWYLENTFLIEYFLEHEFGDMGE